MATLFGRTGRRACLRPAFQCVFLRGTVECFAASRKLDAHVPQGFWRETRSFKVFYQNTGHNGLENMRLLQEIGRRTKPINIVFLSVVDVTDMSSGLGEFLFSKALSRVKSLRVMRFRASFDSWRAIWRYQSLRNDTLTGLHIRGSFSIVGCDELVCVRHLEVIHDYLQTNWFLEEVSLPPNGLYAGRRIGLLES
jgi:hypothetical protein